MRTHFLPRHGPLLAACLSLGLHSFTLLSPFTLRAYDSETHLFFADHYQRGWFGPWDERWFGGFWVWGYPPLVHQLLALIGAVADLDIAYRVVQAVAVFLFPLALARFARPIVGPRSAAIAALLSATVGGVYLVLYTFGQLPSFVAMVAALAGCASLAAYVRHGRGRDLLRWCLLAATAVAAHHHTVLIILPLLATATVATAWCRADGRRRATLWRAMAAAGACGVAVVVTILPFWWWYLTERLPQAPIPHPSRDDPFKSPVTAEMFLFGMYAGIGLAAPFAALAVRRHRRLVPIVGVTILLATLGLGAVTPLPALLFGGWWDWLTYERFSLWAAVLLTIPAAVGLTRLRHRPAVWAPLAAAMLGLAATQANFTTRHDVLPRALLPWEEAEIVKFLDADDHGDWTYLTIGMGEAQLARLSRQVQAQTLDGTYYTGRIRPELRASGIGTFDAAWWWPAGRQALAEVLRRPEEHSLKWVIAARREFDPTLRLAGWWPLHPIGSDSSYRTGDPVNSLVWIWQAPDARAVPPVEPVVVPPRPRFFGFLWGTVPLAALALALAALAWPERTAVPRTALHRSSARGMSIAGGAGPGSAPEACPASGPRPAVKPRQGPAPRRWPWLRAAET